MSSRRDNRQQRRPGDHAHATCYVWAYCVKTGKKTMVNGVFTIGILSQFRKEFEGDSCNALHRQTVFTDSVSAQSR